MMRTEAEAVMEVEMPERRLWTVKEAAIVLNVHQKTIRRAIDSGEIKHSRIRDLIRIPQAEIDRLLNGRAKRY